MYVEIGSWFFVTIPDLLIYFFLLDIQASQVSESTCKNDDNNTAIGVIVFSYFDNFSKISRNFAKLADFSDWVYILK